MLVEDDKSLREIYGVRLLAEGYDIVSAGDGEEALAVAIKERPALIVTDVMMPKISGFDMLDILRSTTETKDIKVIMMTALSSDDNKDRSERLGADRYLVKSQVGIEDVVRVVHEVLGDQGQQPAARPSFTAPIPAPVAAPPAPAPAPAVARPAPVTPPPAPSVLTTPVVAPRVQVTPPSNNPTASASRPQGPVPTTNVVSADDSPSRRSRIIQPISSPTDRPNIQDLVNKEMAKEQEDTPVMPTSVSSGTADTASASTAPATSTAEEKDVVQQQLNDFMKTPAPAPPAAPTPSTLPPFNPTDEPEAPAVAAPVQSQPQIGFPQAPAAPTPPQPGAGSSPQPPQAPAA